MNTILRALRPTLGLLAAVLLATALAGCLIPSAESPPAAGAPEVTRAEVVGHTDGDTIRVRMPDGTRERVRLIGIDTPEVGERSEPLGEEASAFTAGEVPRGSTVWLETDVELRDRYGRLLAYVWLEQPESADEATIRSSMLNARIAVEGYANAYTYVPNVKYQGLLGECESDARAAGRGLWAE